ncbi:hypothetical protein FE392_06745 [Xenorhabdus sp. 12]|uniref:Uncharacterized protein n=1 Tax=Xenorhabdus santafensis TaxID=2582833 RepID=A0ABU4S8D4_9GAMM|nr:hypothetical protein [Xenorhabdus sp. 12]MDX7987030.1 hypothetical protein [Xenorhabdus sp. 12]
MQQYIKQGKLPTTTVLNKDGKIIDVFELIRAFGALKVTHDDTVTNEVKIQLLEQENSYLKTEK